jgi:hypothetical protein
MIIPNPTTEAIELSIPPTPCSNALAILGRLVPEQRPTNRDARIKAGKAWTLKRAMSTIIPITPTAAQDSRVNGADGPGMLAGYSDCQQQIFNPQMPPKHQHSRVRIRASWCILLQNERRQLWKRMKQWIN